MQHRDYVIKWLLYALVTLLFVLVQVFGLVHLRVWGVHPFVFPALVAVIAALEPAHESAIYALIFGVVLDLTMPGVIPCFYTVTFLVVFVLTQLLATKVLSAPFLCCILCGSLGIVCTGLLNALFLSFSVSVPYRAAGLLLAKELLLTLPLLPLVYLPAWRIRRIFHQE